MKFIKTLHRTDRQTILSNTIAFAKVGLVSFSVVIDILSQLTDQTDLLVGRVMIGAFNLLADYFPSVKSELIKLGVKLFRPMLDSIGLEPKKGESAGNGKLRLSLFSVLGIYCAEKDIYEFGVNIFQQFRKADSLPDGGDPNLLPFILRCGCLYTNDGLDYVLNLALNSPRPDIQARSCTAIGFVKEQDIPKALTFFDKLRVQDLHALYFGLCANPNANILIWNHFKDSFDKLMKIFGGLGMGMDYFVESVSSLFNTEEGAQEFSSFFETHECKVAERQIKQSLEAIRIRAKANTSALADIRNRLK